MPDAEIHPAGHWIAGRRWLPDDEPSIDVRSPIDGSLVSRVVVGSEADVDSAARSAQDAQAAWADATPRDRAATLLAIENAIRARSDELVELEFAETGKPRKLIEGEIDASADYFGFYAAAARTTGGETFDVGPGLHLFTVREPFGVVAVITPWNYSVNQAARSVAPALAAGNTVVLKPSEWTSAAIVAMAEIMTAAGLPDGVLNVVTGDGAHTGAALVRHPLVRRVTFTGSVAAGRRVAELAAVRLVPVTLELGGKSPQIVFADADLETAARVIADEFIANSGQTCSAGTRLLADEQVYDELLEEVLSHARRQRPGHELGPIITQEQFERVRGHLASAAEEGAVAMLGGSVARDPALTAGRFVEPTVYTRVAGDARVWREEIFGPVLAAAPFTDEANALELANDTPYGLTAGVWTADIDRALRLARRLQAGQVYVNGWGAPIEAPFGGYKDSGYGREKGRAAIDEYTQVKTVSVTLSA